MNNIETMKLALEALEYMTKGTISGGNEKTKQAIKEMRQAIEQTEKQEPATVLPDGSAFSVMSWPLPKNHWLYAEREYRDGEYEPMELGKPILTHQLRDSVVSAVRYAVRGATNCGKEVDFDPDALVQNAVYALCGPYGQAIEQAQQAEPWEKFCDSNCVWTDHHPDCKLAEPVACGYDETTGNCTNNPCCYTSPPPRQPLTDEEIAHATAPVFMGGNPSLTGIARAIESAHGIKEKNT